MNGVYTCSHVIDVSILAEHLHAYYACLDTDPNITSHNKIIRIPLAFVRK